MWNPKNKQRVQKEPKKAGKTRDERVLKMIWRLDDVCMTDQQPEISLHFQAIKPIASQICKLNFLRLTMPGVKTTKKRKRDKESSSRVNTTPKVISNLLHSRSFKSVREVIKHGNPRPPRK